MFLTQINKKCVGESKETLSTSATGPSGQQTLRNPEVVQSCTTEETKETNSISVTNDIHQLCKGEDVVPVFLKSDTHVVMMIGDGHGGKRAAEILDTNSGDILQEILSHGVQKGMDMCDTLCGTTHAGAMVVLAMYSITERTLDIISRGDASCTVYQNGEMIHEQPHHSRQVVDADEGILTESGDEISWKEKCRELNIGMPIGKVPTMNPQKDGQTMLVVMRPEYFTWLYGTQVAGCSFVGHAGLQRLPACRCVVNVPPGDWHAVLSSDGVSDVIHPEDTLLRNDGVKAQDIVKEALKRWTTPHFAPTKQTSFISNNDIDLETGREYFVINPHPSTFNIKARWKSTGAFYKGKILQKHEDGTYDVRFPDDRTTRKDIPANEVRISEKNIGGDDISVLVLESSEIL